MIVELISKYLETHKRLVVPNLGTFIVKVPGQTILFSNLIKNDDGVLRSLLTDSGISEMAAAAAVDRFVFEVRFRLQNNGICRLGGFGELHNGANETVTFTYMPSTQGDGGIDADMPRQPKSSPAVEPQHAAENPAQPATAKAAAQPAQAPQPAAAAQPARPARQQPGPRPQNMASRPARQPRPASEAATAAEPMPGHMREQYADTVEEPQRPVETEPETVRRHNPDVRRAGMKALYEDPHISISPKRHPADYVKGLRYGKGRKGAADRDMGSHSRRRNDRILIIAIVAAALAIAALGYGYYCDLRAARMEDEYYGVQEENIPNPDMEYIEGENQ